MNYRVDLITLDGKNVRQQVRPSVHPSVRPQKVFPISMKFGLYVQMHEPFTMGAGK